VLAAASISIVPLNAPAKRAADSSAMTDSSSMGQSPCFVLLDEAWRGTQDLADIFEGMQQPCFGMQLLQVRINVG